MRLVGIKELQAEDSFIIIGEPVDFDIDLTGTATDIALPFRLKIERRSGTSVENFADADLLIQRNGTTANISKSIPSDPWKDYIGPLIWSLHAQHSSGDKPFLWGKIFIEKIPS